MSAEIVVKNEKKKTVLESISNLLEFLIAVKACLLSLCVYLQTALTQPAVAYHKVRKFWDTRKLCCNVPKIITKGRDLRVFRQKDANGIANSADPDQPAPNGAV